MIKEADHRRLAEFIESTTGIQLPTAKRYLIEGRLAKRQRALGMNNLSDYLQFVLKDPDGRAEQQQLIDVLTTNKTNFFRESNHFELLAHQILDHLLAHRTKTEEKPLLRIWSAACSSGEEVYTLAMVLLEAKERIRRFDVHIHGSDICTQVLKTAAAGVYNQRDIEPVPDYLRRKYFLRHASNPNKIKMGPELRSIVRFSQVNLLQDHFNTEEPYDVIFCRNMMIYLNDSDRNRLLGKFRQSLPTWGALFVGHSERIDETQHRLRVVAPAAYLCT